MRKRTLPLEWHFLEDSMQGQAARGSLPGETTFTTPERYARAYRQPIWVMALVILLILLFAGRRVWQTAQAGLEQINNEVHDAVQLDLAVVMQGDDSMEINQRSDPVDPLLQVQLEHERNILHTALPAGQQDIELSTDVETLTSQGDVAVTNVIMSAIDGRQAYRQTRFYRQTPEGWQRTQPTATLWGSPHTLESSHFVFLFRQKDSQTVAAVAPQMDELYTTLLHNFGLTPDTEKLVVEISVEVIGGMLTSPWPHSSLVVPSPALNLAPANLSDREILAQAITLPLIDYMLARASETYDIPTRWRSFLLGVRLWQLWDTEMPLAQWRHDVVEWLYNDAPMAQKEQEPVLPARYVELCAMHSLWMPLPRVIGIPLSCSPTDAAPWFQQRILGHVPLNPRDDLARPLDEWEPYGNYYYGSSAHDSHRSVIAATLVEYSVAIYGHERLPRLLAALAQYNDLDSLLSTVFGINSDQFLEGWYTYMAEQYNVQPRLGH